METGITPTWIARATTAELRGWRRHCEKMVADLAIKLRDAREMYEEIEAELARRGGQ